MANDQNLIRPKRDRTAKQRRENARKAGIASGKKRHERKALQDLAKIVLNMPVGPGGIDDIEDMDLSEIRKKNLTIGEKAVLMAGRKASKGDLSALSFLRDTAGEKPVEKVEVSADVAKASADIDARITAMKARHSDDGR